MSRREGLLKRLSLKRPRAAGQWPASGMVLIASLAFVFTAVLVLSLVLAPTQWPSDRWAALSAIYGAGAFLLAVAATVIATIAYINSTEKPRFVVHTSRSEDLQDWSLGLQLENRGQVAARFVAVRLRFVGTKTSDPDDQLPMRPWTPSGLQGWHGATEAVWEGGADVVIHPDWTYRVPPFRCKLSKAAEDKPCFVDVVIVADDVRPFLTRLNLLETSVHDLTDWLSQLRQA